MSFPSILEAQELIREEALEVASFLQSYDMKIVLAESCTGGMVSGILAGIPGISEYLCGSLVTYRNETKTAWLGISPKDLDEHGSVSEKTSLQMALRALEVTPEAGLAASVTGHLGPNAPQQLDGFIYCGVAMRTGAEDEIPVFASEYQLSAPAELTPEELRFWRQLAASHSLLLMVRSLLEQLSQTEHEPREAKVKPSKKEVRRKKEWKTTQRVLKTRKKTKRSN